MYNGLSVGVAYPWSSLDSKPETRQDYIRKKGLLAMDCRRTQLGQLNSANTALFVCDIQEKFRPAIWNFKAVVSNTKKLLSGCSILSVPVVVTEQYPKGLGVTVAELDLESIPIALKVEKTQFNMVTPAVEEAMISTLCKDGLSSVVICGIETHVCVEQTAIDLLARGISVHVAADCCTSRTNQDRNLALQRLSKIGCHVTTCETVLFKLLGDKQHAKFQEISKLVREPCKDVGLFV